MRLPSLFGSCLLALLTALAAPPVAQGAVKVETVEYKDGDVLLQGELVYDDAKTGPRPGVLVVHEWKGRGEYSRMRAAMLAELGYVAFACDMYGKGVYAKDHDEAGKLAGAFFGDREKMRRRAHAGLEVLRRSPRVDPKRLGAIGYCFGGTTVLELARAGEEGLLTVQSFHGNLSGPVPAKKGAVGAVIEAWHGEKDTFVPEAVVKGFQKEMAEAGARATVHVMPGAVHSFTVKEAGDDPSKGMAYQEAADRASWAGATKTLAELLKP